MTFTPVQESATTPESTEPMEQFVVVMFLQLYK